MEHQATTHADELALLTPRQAAEMLGCSVNSVYRLVAQGGLKAIDISLAGSQRPKMRVRRTDLKAFVDGRAQGAPS
jgi:excisionase family DNA binding protein